jgi:hypothetical protein
LEIFDDEDNNSNSGENDRKVKEEETKEKAKNRNKEEKEPVQETFRGRPFFFEREEEKKVSKRVFERPKRSGQIHNEDKNEQANSSSVVPVGLVDQVTPFHYLCRNL